MIDPRMLGFAGLSPTYSGFREPYPARAAVGVAALPRGALVEVDAVLVKGE